MNEFQSVRIKALLQLGSRYDSFGKNDRQPQVGDTGTIVKVNTQPDGKCEYTVECGRPDGTCAWIADFVEEELEPIQEAPARTMVHRERESSSKRPVGLREKGAVTEESLWSHWYVFLLLGVLLLLAFAVVIGAFYYLFVVSPPQSASGGGLRAAIGGVVLVTAGSLLAGEKFGDVLITATIVAILFFVLGAVGWNVWLAP